MPSSVHLLLSSPPSTFLYPSNTPKANSCYSKPLCQMATYPRACPFLEPSFCQLSSELLALVFEQLQGIDLNTLRALRLVSKRFDAIATPIIYRTLTLNECIVDPNAEALYHNAFHHIALHTNHVIVSSHLDSEGITRILSLPQRLFSVRWRFRGESFDTTNIWVPSYVLNPHEARFKHTKLHIENLPLQGVHNLSPDAYLQSVPGRLLASLQLAAPSPALTTQLVSLKRLLVQSPWLKTLHYNDRGQGTSFKFEYGERMPPLTHLSMRSYNWDHTSKEVQRHWDFSHIESLKLISVPTFNFLASISFESFSGLQVLHVEDYSAHLPDRRQEATAGLYLLVKNYIRALKVLDITCHTQIFSLDGITQHSRTLQVLRFRDHAGFCDEDRRCPTLWPNQMELLGRQLAHVHTLELDLDISLCDPYDFLHAVCEFPSLHTLTLNVQTIIQTLSFVSPGIDYDYDAAMQTFNFLIHTKRQSTPAISWKNITIKVGGWKPIMVRRLGSRWQEYNANGIFAERCFVLELDSQGGFKAREEMCLETWSRRNTPELEHGG